MPALNRTNEGFDISLVQPSGICVINGKILIGRWQGDMHWFTFAGVADGTIARNSSNTGTAGLGVYNNQIYNCDQQRNDVFYYAVSGTYVGRWNGLGSGNNGANGITFGAGNWWIGNAAASKPIWVYKYAPDGTYVSRWEATHNNAVAGMGFWNGHVMVYDQGGSFIREYDTDGTYIQSWELPDANINGIFIEGDEVYGVISLAGNTRVVVYEFPAANTATVTQTATRGLTYISRRDTGVTGGFGYDGSTIYKESNFFGYIEYNSSTGVETDRTISTSSGDRNNVWTGTGRTSSNTRLFLRDYRSADTYILSYVRSATFDSGFYNFNYGIAPAAGNVVDSISYNSYYYLLSGGKLEAFSSETTPTDDNHESSLDITVSGTGTAFGVVRIGETFFVGFTGRQVKQYKANAPNYGAEVSGGGFSLDPANDTPVSFATNGTDTITCYDEDGFIYTYRYAANNRFEINVSVSHGIKPTAAARKLLELDKPVTQKLAIKPDADRSLRFPIEVTERPTRYVFISPTNDKFVVYEAGRFTTHAAAGSNEIGIARLGDHWYTCDNSNDFLRKYNLDFTVNTAVDASSFLTTPQGMAVHRGILLVVDLADDKVNFLNDDLTLRGEGSLHSANGDARGITADDDYIYVIDNTTNEVFRYTVDLDTFALTLVSRWATSRGARGIGIFGNNLHVLNTVRAVWRYNKSTGAQGTVALSIPSSIDGENVGPQGMFIEGSDQGSGLGFGTAASQKPRVRADVQQKAAFKDSVIKAVYKEADQKVAIKPDADKTLTLPQEADQKVAFKPDADTLFRRERGADQKLAIKPKAEHRIVVLIDPPQQNLAIKPDVGRDKKVLIRQTISQKLAIKPDADESRQARISRTADQKLGIKPDAVKATYEEVTQKVAFKPDGDKTFTLAKEADQKVAIKPDVDEEHTVTLSKTAPQKLAIKPDAGKTTTTRISVTEKPPEFVLIDTANTSFLVYSSGFRASHALTGGTATGLTRYEGSWFTLDNTNDYLRQFDDDFTHIGFTDLSGSITLPHALGVFRQYMIIGNRADDSIFFTTGVGAVQFSVPLHADNGRISGLAADDTYIYTVDQTENQIFRYEVTLGTNSATFGAPTRWNIDGTGPRGMGISGNILYIINSKRETKAYSTADGSYLGVIFTAALTHPGLASNFNPQAIHADVSSYGGGLGSNATTMHELSTPKSVDQKLAIKPDGDVSTVKTIVRAVTQKLAIKPSEVIKLGVLARQKVAFKPTAKKASEFSEEVDQKVGIKDDRELSFRRVRQVSQKLRFKTGHSVGGFAVARQKLGIRPKSTIALAESVEQKVGIKDDAEGDRTVHRDEEQKLGVKDDADKERIRHREGETKLGIAPDADKERVDSEEGDQKLGIGDSVDTLVRYSASVIQKLRFHVSSAPELPSDAPLFKFKDKIRRVFRV